MMSLQTWVGKARSRDLRVFFESLSPTAKRVLSEGRRGVYHIAARHKRHDILDLLHEYAPEDLLTTDIHGNTCMHIAASMGVSLKFFLNVAQRAPQLLSQRNLSGITPLHQACGQDNFKILEYLVQAGHPLVDTACRSLDNAVCLAIRTDRVLHIETMVRLGFRSLHLWNNTSYSQFNRPSQRVYNTLVALTTNVTLVDEYEQPTEEECRVIRNRVHFQERSSYRVYLNILRRQRQRQMCAIKRREIYFRVVLETHLS